MKINRYIDLRNCHKEFIYKILNSDKGAKLEVKRACKKLGFLRGESMVVESEEESNVLMDYLLYENNGRTNRLIDRYAKLSNLSVDEDERIVLNGMLNNIFSIFEVKHIDHDERTLDLFDLLENQLYKLVDIGFSQTARKGAILATRLIPIEDVCMTSGLSFGFEEDKRLKLLTEVSKQRRRKHRKKRMKKLFKRVESTSTLEIMFKASKKWGIDVVTIEH